jgi:hypothetical protein
MTNTEKVVKEIIDRYRAGFPIIWVKTEEYTRVIEILHREIKLDDERCAKIAESRFKGQEVPVSLKPKNVFHWDALNGLVNITTPTSKFPKVYPTPDVKGEPAAWMHILSWANHLSLPVDTVPAGSVVFVNGFHNLLAGAPATDTGRLRSALIQIIRPSLRKKEGKIIQGLREDESFRTVIMVGPKPDHPALSPDVMTYLEVIDFPRPDETEIAQMIELNFSERETSKGQSVTQDKALVNLCSKELKGTTSFQSENAASLTFIKKRELDRDTIRKQYKGIMELHPALTLAEYQEDWDDLVGFELYKKYIAALFHPDQRPDRSLKGVLFVGAPGTGKSHCAKATGAYLGLKTIFCNFGRVFNKFVGSSEENVESLFRSIDACGESIVFIDEIEKALGGIGKGGGGDSGVGDRVMQQTLTWMNDHNSGAFIIATANDPHILPPELLREGRWNCIFNVPPPNVKQREALVELYARKSRMGKVDIAGIAQRTDNWVGAEIKGLMEKAEIFRIGSKSDEDAIETAFKYLRPMCVSDATRFNNRVEESKKQGVSVNLEDDEEASGYEMPEVQITEERKRSFDL